MVNIVILVGNVGGDPSLRTMSDGGRVANFSLATSESWKDNTGVRREKTEWHKIVVFNNNLIEIVEKYITKGKKLFIQGSLKTRKFTDSSGVEKYTTEVIIRGFGDTIRILDGRSDSQEDTYSRESAHGDVSVPGKTPTATDTEDDDAIPF